MTDDMKHDNHILAINTGRNQIIIRRDFVKYFIRDNETEILSVKVIDEPEAIPLGTLSLEEFNKLIRWSVEVNDDD